MDKVELHWLEDEDWEMGETGLSASIGGMFSHTEAFNLDRVSFTILKRLVGKNESRTHTTFKNRFILLAEQITFGRDGRSFAHISRHKTLAKAKRKAQRIAKELQSDPPLKEIKDEN